MIQICVIHRIQWEVMGSDMFIDKQSISTSMVLYLFLLSLPSKQANTNLRLYGGMTGESIQSLYFSSYLIALTHTMYYSNMRKLSPSYINHTTSSLSLQDPTLLITVLTDEDMNCHQ